MQRRKYKHYLLALLTVILLFNYVDRFALGVVLQDIKIDLSLTDTQLGFLTGIAFALFYSTMGLPIARWADRGDRVVIISLAAAIWSVAVALCGTAATFAQLLLIRVAVAVGEAGCIPPAFSLIADYFSRAERPRAAAVYGLGGPLSALVGFLIAGWLNELYGWRTTFVVLGLPGVALAAVAWLTLKEPRRQAAQREQVQSRTDPPPSLRLVIVTLWTNATFRHLLLCLSVSFFFGYGVLTWQPAFFIRSHGFSTGQIGTWFGVIFAVAGLVGVYLGGELPSRYAAHNERLQLKAMAAGIAAAGVLSLFVYLTSNPYVALLLLFLAAIGQATVNGPLFATIQTLIPDRMRAVSFACLYLCANLIGMGLGPLAVGVLSDLLHQRFGEDSIRYGLLLLTPGYFWVAWHALCASKTVMRDLAASQAHVSPESAGGVPDAEMGPGRLWVDRSQPAEGTAARNVRRVASGGKRLRDAAK